MASASDVTLQDGTVMQVRNCPFCGGGVKDDPDRKDICPFFSMVHKEECYLVAVKGWVKSGKVGYCISLLMKKDREVLEVWNRRTTCHTGQ